MFATSSAIAGEREPAAGPAGRLNEDLDRLLRRVTDVWQSRLAPLMQAQGLSEPRYQILGALFRRMPTGCSQTELASELFQSESNLSTLLERMQSDGLIRRQRSPIDRRKVTIQLAEAGAAVLTEARAERQHQIGRLLSGFELDRRQELATGLQSLLNWLSPQHARHPGPPYAGGVPPQRSVIAPRLQADILEMTSSKTASTLAEHKAL